MTTITMYLNHNVEFGGYSWTLKPMETSSNAIVSEAHEVELPEGIYLGSNKYGEQMFCREGSKQGYELTINHPQAESRPVLVGGDTIEMLYLNVQ